MKIITSKEFYCYHSFICRDYAHWQFFPKLFPSDFPKKNPPLKVSHNFNLC